MPLPEGALPSVKTIILNFKEVSTVKKLGGSHNKISIYQISFKYPPGINS
jgi:hypothetical protein